MLPVEPLDNLDCKLALNLLDNTKTAVAQFTVLNNSFSSNFAVVGNLIRLDVIGVLNGKRYG